MIEASPINVGIVLLIINGGIQWIRELKKKPPRDNGKELQGIKEGIGECAEKLIAIDKKVGETKVLVREQKGHCTKTVTRFDKDISDQGQTIIDLAKNSGRRRS